MGTSLMRCYSRDIARNIPTKEIEKHLKFVVYVVYRLRRLYNYPSHILEDLVQAGNLGLMEACKKFDASKGFKFTSYAINWINAYIIRELRFLKYPVKLNQVNEMKLKDNPITSVNIDSIELLPAPPTSDVDYTILRKQIKEDLKRNLFKLLTTDELTLIDLRYFKRQSFSKIGQDRGLTKQRIHQLETNIFSKLKSNLGMKNIFQTYMEFSSL